MYNGGGLRPIFINFYFFLNLDENLMYQAILIMLNKDILKTE